jgi:probable phosphoglycerate mutase
MLCSILGIGVGQSHDQMPIASVSVVELAERGRLLHLMGDRPYLREALRFAIGNLRVKVEGR